MSLADELGKLSELRASGGLTDEEFQRAKQRLLGLQVGRRQSLGKAQERRIDGVHVRSP